MSPEVKTRMEKVALWLLGIVGTIGIGATLGILVELRDNSKYIQPQVDKEQNDKIMYVSRFITSADSICATKNGATNQRIDKLNDVMKPINAKVDILLDMNKKALERYKAIERYFELQTNK